MFKVRTVNMLKGALDGVEKRLEVTQCIIKPCACANPHTLTNIRSIILENYFYVLKSRHLLLKRADSEQFYSVHREKFFFNRLVTYMSSGPVYAHILAGEDAIAKWRFIMGPTKSYRARYEAPSSIRGRFGLTDTRNATHGSDSTMSAMQEIQFFFPDFDLKRWYETEESNFRHGRNVVFDNEAFEHRLVAQEKSS